MKCVTDLQMNLTDVEFFFQVNFSEPLSFLQRLTEDFEYSDCLDNAASSADSFEQLAYVAAFTVSSYANTTLRTGKPFNPLLGETFECDRMEDLGWRSFAEQVLVILIHLVVKNKRNSVSTVLTNLALILIGTFAPQQQ